MTSRQDEALQIAEDLFTDIELSRSSTARRALKAQRLARLTRNAKAMEWLGFELEVVPRTEAGRAWMSRTGRWTDRANDKGYWSSVAGIEANRDGFQKALDGYIALVNLSGDSLLAVMNSRQQAITTHTEVVTKLNIILAKIDRELYRFAADTYAELKYSELQATLFEQSRIAIDSRLAGMAGEALKLIDSVAERLGNDDTSAVSQAMVTCRQLIDSAADHLFPGTEDPYDNGTGKPLDVKADKTKNRINAYVHQQGVRGGRAARIGTNLNHLYDRISAGVHHNEVIDGSEARYLFLNTYMLLGEVLTLPKRSLRENAAILAPQTTISITPRPHSTHEQV